MSAVSVLPQEVIDAFHMMWGRFPEPVSLVHKTHEVMAVNEVYEKLGVLKPGMKCNKLGQPQDHAGCLAQKAVAANQPMYCYNKIGDKEIIGYWIPLEKYPEFFLHFGVGTMINYKTMMEEPLQISSEIESVKM